MFIDSFDFATPARINVVGGGGKTSLILKLLEEFAASGPAVYTTTTRIHPPHPAGGFLVISCDDDATLAALLTSMAADWCPGRRFVASHLSHAPNLVPGVNPDFAGKLDPGLFPVLLNEADGARGMSLKMPRAGEPVLMEGANYLVPVIGLDCLNQALGPETLFRWELAARRFHLPAGRILDAGLAASILLHPEGVCKDWTPGAQIIPFINKADSDADGELALALADALYRCGHFPIHRVIWGSVQSNKAMMYAG